MTSGRIKYLENYSWLSGCFIGDRRGDLASYFKFKESEGTEISFIEQSHPFSKYFHAFKEKIKFECVLEIAEGLKEYIKIIAKNKVQEIISCEIQINGGKIIFIPPLTLSAPDKETGVLLDCLRGILEIGFESPPPSWIDKYTLPNETINAEKIMEIEKEINKLCVEKRKMEEEQINISKFKGLLYEKGKRALEPLVREAFRLIGFKVLEPKEYDEDYDLYIKEDQITIIGEIEGTDNSAIDVNKYRQLLDYVEHESLKGINCKGILIGNAFINKDPAERENQFSSHAIKGCERQKFCMITTHQIFEIVKIGLSDLYDAEMEKIRSNIISCDKEFILG
jgi:hypothetical protein